MQTFTRQLVAPYTSLKVGGVAQTLILPSNTDELIRALQALQDQPYRILGYGCNVLVSDTVLEGTTIIVRGGTVTVEGDLVIADAGVWWDDVVRTAIDHHLWGLELMSEIPSSVGAAIFGNIAAYGAQISDTLEWVDVYDTQTHETTRHPASNFSFAYRASSLQSQPHAIILRAAFRLSTKPMHELKYDSALAIGDELGLDHTTITYCRDIVIETRRRAGSLYSPNDPNSERSAGSFFKNPMVTEDQARLLASYDETGKTLERIENQSKIHGGDSHRASAAHVLLAAGFHRGQTWGHVQLHDRHVLKIVTHDGATATDVYRVVQEILSTVKEKLEIELEPEVKFIGSFRQ